MNNIGVKGSLGSILIIMYNSKKEFAKKADNATKTANWRKSFSESKNHVNNVDGVEKPNRHLARQQRRSQKKVA